MERRFAIKARPLWRSIGHAAAPALSARFSDESSSPPPSPPQPPWHTSGARVRRSAPPEGAASNARPCALPCRTLHLATVGAGVISYIAPRKADAHTTPLTPFDENAGQGADVVENGGKQQPDEPRACDVALRTYAEALLRSTVCCRKSMPGSQHDGLNFMPAHLGEHLTTIGRSVIPRRERTKVGLNACSGYCVISLYIVI